MIETRDEGIRDFAEPNNAIEKLLIGFLPMNEKKDLNRYFANRNQYASAWHYTAPVVLLKAATKALTG
jgi:hypothetical protein